VLDHVKGSRRVTWAMLFEKSDVLDIEPKQVSIGLRDVGSHRAFSQGGHAEIVRQALIDVVGLDREVTAILDPSTAPAATATPPPAAPSTPKPAPKAAADARAAAAAVDGPVMGKERSDDAVDDDVAVDDADAADSDLSGAELIAQQLGGKVIGEIDHD
jgi:DNA polymerase-3 subunit gamma/tau